MEKKSMFGEGGLKAAFSNSSPLPVNWDKETDKSIHSFPDTITDTELQEQLNEIQSSGKRD